MAIFSKFIVLSATLLAIANAVPVEKRGVIDHDKVVGFSETVPGGTLGAVYLAYKPHLKVVNGCVPFPAVDATGNTSGGLKPTGGSHGGCSSSTGQVYVRGGVSGGHYGLMYTWYMPKDEPSDGLGHRHDWEGVIVWLKDSTATTAANIAAICPSAHGGWDCSTDNLDLSGTSPLLQYEAEWPINHSVGTTTDVGGQQPLISWGALPAVARAALENTDFGSAIVPFKDATFANNLGKATY